MTHLILSKKTASIAEFKKHPLEILNRAEGEPLAILSRNEPVFYCITSKMYEAMMDALENIKLAEIVKERANEAAIPININDL